MGVRAALADGAKSLDLVVDQGCASLADFAMILGLLASYLVASTTVGGTKEPRPAGQERRRLDVVRSAFERRQQ